MRFTVIETIVGKGVYKIVITNDRNSERKVIMNSSKAHAEQSRDYYIRMMRAITRV